MHIIEEKEMYAPTLFALIPIPFHWPTSENAHNNESAEHQQDSVDTEKDEKSELRVKAVKGE